MSSSPTSTNTNGSVTMSITNTAGAASGFYNILVTAASGAIVNTAPFYLDLLSNNFELKIYQHQLIIQLINLQT